MKGFFFFFCLNYAFGVLLGIKYRFMRFMITIIIVKFICIALFRKEFFKKTEVINLHFRRI